MGAESKRELRRLFRRGRTSLAIGLAFLGATVAAGDLLAGAIDEMRLGSGGASKESWQRDWPAAAKGTDGGRA